MAVQNEHTDPLLGRQLANFRLERPLGRGGMAQVYYGWDVKLQRPVAIKVIDARFRDNPTYAERFVREARTIAGWSHEHIIHIYYADDQDDLYYFAMEYLDGQDLGQLLAQSAAKSELLAPAEVLRIGRAVASALDYAHQRGIIHRDVKPSNIMVARDGRVVLTDFGLALDVQQGSLGEIFGSAHYIAPEQARDSAAAVPQSDLYALGVILYEMLVGVVPFDDPSPTALAVQHLTHLPPPPRDLNPDLNQRTEAVLLKALSKSPGLRFKTGRALMDALEYALQSDPAAAAPQTLPPLLPQAVVDARTEAVRRASPSSVPPVASAWTQAPHVPESQRRNSFLIAGVGLSLALLIICGSAGAIFFFRGGNGNPPVSAGGPVLPVIVLIDTPASTATPTIQPTPTSLPTETPTATPFAPVLLTLTPTPLPTDTFTPTPPPTDTATSVPPTDTPIPSPLPTDTATPESPTPTPISEAPANYELLITQRDDDSLFVVNQTDVPFPLAPLRLGDEAGLINGTDWGLEQLESGACVTVWKEEGNPKPPRVDCTEVGTRLTRQGDERFWRKEFNIYYNEQPVGQCDQNKCSVTIPQVGRAQP